MRLFAILTCLVCFQAFAQDYLEPERSTFSGNAYNDGYHKVLVSAFEEAFERDVVARVVVVPSFSPEYIIGMKDYSGVYKVFRLMPDASYWANDANLETYADIRITKCEQEIAKDLAASVFSAWEAVLLQTKYEKSDGGGLDGVTYHFAVRSGSQVFAGETWTPQAEAPPLKLVQLAGAMGEWCGDPTAGNLEAVGMATSAVRAVL